MNKITAYSLLLLIVSPTSLADFSTEQLIQDTPVYCRDNIEAIADCILQHYHNGDLKHL